MRHVTHETLTVLSASVIALAVAMWAASNQGAAHLLSAGTSGVADTQQPRRSTPAHRRPPAPKVPRAVPFRDVKGRGLLVKAWVNSKGPFTFAVDTGAGATVLSQRVATEAGVEAKRGRTGRIAGLSGVSVSTEEGVVQTLALGEAENYLPAREPVIITTGLPAEVDGVVDPSESYAPLGYIIDLPQRELSAFDPNAAPIRLETPPPDGAVVRWIRDSYSRRPFVLLADGRRALLDTGSNLGLAIRDRRPATNHQEDSEQFRDVGGGLISARHVKPTTVSVGSLTLQNIPTDLVSGAEVGAPVLLGLRALRPFRLKFDPLHRLIEIAPRPE